MRNLQAIACVFALLVAICRMPPAALGDAPAPPALRTTVTAVVENSPDCFPAGDEPCAAVPFKVTDDPAESLPPPKALYAPRQGYRLRQHRAAFAGQAIQRAVRPVHEASTTTYSYSATADSRALPQGPTGADAYRRGAQG